MKKHGRKAEGVLLAGTEAILTAAVILAALAGMQKEQILCLLLGSLLLTLVIFLRIGGENR